MRRARAWLVGLATVLVLGAAYLVFELGRYEAGYSLLDHRNEVERLRTRVGEQAQRIEELERELAMLETSSEIDQETYAQLKVTLTELEAKLQAQEEELAFYRGIISPPDGQPGLRVQSVEVAPGNGEQRYVLRIVLMQAIAQNRKAAGVVRLSVSGNLHGEPQTLGLEELTGAAEVAELEYDFRYFQGLEQEITLPDGFEPLDIEVEVRPSEPRGEPLTQTFEWAAVSGVGPEE
ncbi:MAG TPA: DUF6776 family protein [Gammaproteobacteria bacterium]